MWRAYVVLWLGVWIVLITRPGTWPAALGQWPMALVMALGSFVAGSTPMGGGTVAFPVLVLGFDRSPVMARDFGFAIQSVGMTSAMLFIFARNMPVERRMLLWSCVGAVIGLVFGTWLLAGRVPADWVKLVFATLWTTFGAWLVTGARAEASLPLRPADGRDVSRIGLAVGVVGGAIASLIGVGLEMLVYATLVLRFGWGPKAAVPTAVCATALASPVGLALRFLTEGVHPEVFPVWLAAMPVVIFGAPAGAFILKRVPRLVLLRVIGALCLVQFGATVAQVRPTPEQWTGVAVLAVLSTAGLWLLAPNRPASAASAA